MTYLNQFLIEILNKPILKLIQQIKIKPKEELMEARLAQSVERETFNLKAKGSSPLSGDLFLLIH